VRSIKKSLYRTLLAVIRFTDKLIILFRWAVRLKAEVIIMSTELEEKVKASLMDGKLPCAVAFKIAKESKVSPREVGKTANKLSIRICNCQLGCFS